MGVGGQRPAPTSLMLGKTRYPLCKGSGGPQEQSGWVWKVSATPGLDPRTAQPVRFVQMKGMDWINVAQDMDRWRALVNAVMNLRVP